MADDIGHFGTWHVKHYSVCKGWNGCLKTISRHKKSFTMEVLPRSHFHGFTEVPYNHNLPIGCVEVTAHRILLLLWEFALALICRKHIDLVSVHKTCSLIAIQITFGWGQRGMDWITAQSQKRFIRDPLEQTVSVCCAHMATFSSSP